MVRSGRSRGAAAARNAPAVPDRTTAAESVPRTRGPRERPDVKCKIIRQRIGMQLQRDSRAAKRARRAQRAEQRQLLGDRVRAESPSRRAVLPAAGHSCAVPSQAPPPQTPTTIDSKREPDTTTVEPDDAEILGDEQSDELAGYFDGRPPKILITTSPKILGVRAVCRRPGRPCLSRAPRCR